ncbi:apiosidase-like domain-containing protein [Candidatus Mycolicibacterium alkanivorans]|uniref:apiosidase-like domain-containing protein n=1 Tax=Candidatus Mycolicibacterium alkanivorans TaxID=2954114 RepID=UPI00207BF054|nr:DUF4038 domain-containing protein [Candidatus Mycolicibacterium alkanivorans]
MTSFAPSSTRPTPPTRRGRFWTANRSTRRCRTAGTGPPEGYSTPIDVRRDAYWAVFAGAAGHTYGHHSIWQFLGSGGPAALGAVGDWKSALDDEAAWQATVQITE